jgi:hypothetical protein
VGIFYIRKKKPEGAEQKGTGGIQTAFRAASAAHLLLFSRIAVKKRRKENPAGPAAGRKQQKRGGNRCRI